MPVIIDGTSGVTTPTYGGADTSEYLVPVTQFKNRIINGAMVINQRDGGTVSVTNANPYTLDRWQGQANIASSKFTIQQSSTAPTGFNNSLLITSSSTYTVGAGEYFGFSQAIEGYNVADLGFGTANAKTITISFWVRSSLTGTFGAVLANGSNNRSYPFTYSISSADTWEQKSVTITGDTTGTWATNNTNGMYLWFSVGAGSTYSGTAGSWSGSTFLSATGATSVVGTNGATFYITGVQLEVGSTATSFDYRPYGTELQLCQRYYYKWLNDAGAIRIVANLQAYSSSGIYGKLLDFPVPMRSVPTCSRSGTIRVDNATSGDAGNPSTVLLNANTKFSMGSGDITSGISGLSAGNSSVIYMANNGYFDASAEL